MVAVTSSVWKLWRTGEVDNIGLLIKTKVPEAMALVERACEVWVADNDPDNAPEPFGYITAQQTPKGPGIFVDNCDDLKPLLEQFSAALESVGLGEATITVLPAAPFVLRGAESGHPSHFIRARMAIRATEPADLLQSGSVWTVDPAVLAEVLSWTWDFCRAVPGGPRVVTVRATGRDILAPPEAVLDLLTAQARQRDAVLYVEVTGADSAFRSVSIRLGDAEIALSAGVDADKGYDWQRNLAEMTELLLGAPDWVVAASCAKGSDYNGTAILLLHPDAPFEVPERFRSHIGVQRFIEAVQPLDAYGFILIPADCAGPMPTGPEWQIVQTENRTAIRATDAEAWFAHDHLDLALLTQARDSLGDLIAWNRLNPAIAAYPRM